MEKAPVCLIFSVLPFSMFKLHLQAALPLLTDSYQQCASSFTFWEKEYVTFIALLKNPKNPRLCLNHH